MEFRSKYENSWFKAGETLGRPVSGWRYTRPYLDRDKCNRCGWCYLYCPGGCIREQEDFYVIDFDFCKGCGICANECPKKAITMVNEEQEQ